MSEPEDSWMHFADYQAQEREWTFFMAFYWCFTVATTTCAPPDTSLRFGKKKDMMFATVVFLTLPEPFMMVESFPWVAFELEAAS